jgi:hypothetical protein
MFYDVLLILNLVVALYIWFDTDAFIKWSTLLKLKFTKYKEYNEIKKTPLSVVAGKSYCDFLLHKYGQHFLILLITCPVCFTVWCNLILFGVFYSKLSAIWIGPNIIISWILYHALRWILLKLNG